MFNGRSHLQHVTAINSGVMQSPDPSLVGLNPTCSIEVWVNNPTISDEEQMVAWGRTGGTNALIAFSYGDGGGGAGGALNRNAGPNLVGPYHGLAGPNLSWSSVHPRPGTWHHLVYTFDGAGRVNRLYADGAKVEQFTNIVDVNTWAGTNISIATSHGAPNFLGQNNTARSALVIARVRVHSGVLSDAQVLNNYLFELPNFTTAPVALTSGPIHRYSFNIPPTADAVGVTITDSVGTAHGLVQGFAGGNTASTDGNKLHLNGGPPVAASTPPYVDFPNGLLSSLSASNAGPGQITIEGWVEMNGGHIWSPILNFGTTSTGERVGPDVSTTGYQGRNYLNWSLNGNSKALMRFEVGVPSTNDVPTNANLTTTTTADYLMDNKDKVPFSMKHFAITWDEASGVIFIYINGIPAHRVLLPAQKFNSIGDVNVWLGRSPWQGDNYMEGNWDEYRIYDHVLSAAEVAADYHYGPDFVATNLSAVGALSSIQIQPLDITNTWVGRAPQLTVLANYANDTGVDITDTAGIGYSSTDTNVITVSSNGMLRLIAPGTATVTASFSAMTSSITLTNILAPTPTVIHRYSFNIALDYSDSVGGANGTANGTSISDGTKLILDPSGQGYLSFPTNVLAGEQAATIEAWVNVNTAANNSMIWAFGDQNSSTGNGRNGILTTTSPNLRTALFDTDPGFAHEQNAQRNGNLNGLSAQHIVGVYDPLIGKVQVYLNSALVAQVNAISPLTQSIVNPTFLQLGRSLYNADPYWNGSVDEFRIWSGALSQQQIAVNFASGPNSIVSSPGSLLAVSLVLPFSNTVVTVAQQAQFTGNFTSIGGVNLFTYGEAGVTISSDNTNIATVTSAGSVRAVAQGTAHIIASYAGFSATNTITIQSAAPVMQHRYNFNGDAVDSIGAANGTLNGGASFSSGKVVLNAGTGDYVSLPTGIIAGYFATTVEAYVDFGTNISGSWLYGFGDQNGTGNGRFYSYYSPHIGNANRAGITASDPGNTGEQNVTDNVGNLDSLSGVHLAIVTHPFLGFESVYVNGQLRAINTNVTTLLSSVSSNFALIGKSLWDVGGVGGYPTNQPFLNASIDEFRIYQGALTNAQIALDAATGPNTIVTNPGALTSVKLIVNSNMVFNNDQLVQFLGTFASSSVSNVNLFGYTNCTVISSDTNVISTNTLQGSVHGNGTGVATITVAGGGFTNTATITVAAANGPFLALRHRYSFNGDAKDSAGTADGTLMGTASIAGGALVLPGGNNGTAYLDLPNGIISSLTNATFESWSRKTANAGWQRIFDFGSSSGAEGTAATGVTYIFLTTDVGGTPQVRFAYTTNSNGAEAPVLNGAANGAGSATNNTNHIVVTFNTANNASALFINGTSVATGTTPLPLSGLNDINNWLGRSQWAGDPDFGGTIQEFRIYEGILSPTEIAVSSAAGPDGAPPIPSITVGTNSGGNLTLTWPSYALRYALQARDSLTSGSWTNVTPFAPVTTNNIRRVTVPLTGSSKYFRLTD
jgi:hypothetical protein